MNRSSVSDAPARTNLRFRFSRLTPFLAAFLIGSLLAHLFRPAIPEVSTAYLANVDLYGERWWYRDDYSCLPNPLALEVKIDERGIYHLNNESFDSRDSYERLTERLEQVFEQRRIYNVYDILDPYREEYLGTRKVVADYRIVAAQSTPYGTVIQVIDFMNSQGPASVILSADSKQADEVATALPK